MAAEAMTKKKKSLGIVKYFKEIKSELKKVAWPSFAKTRKNTFIVIAYMILIAIIIAILDLLFGTGVRYITTGSWGTAAATEMIDFLRLML